MLQKSLQKQLPFQWELDLCISGQTQRTTRCKFSRGMSENLFSRKLEIHQDRSVCSTLIPATSTEHLENRHQHLALSIQLWRSPAEQSFFCFFSLGTPVFLFLHFLHSNLLSLNFTMPGALRGGQRRGGSPLSRQQMEAEAEEMALLLAQGKAQMSTHHFTFCLPLFMGKEVLLDFPL